jgi:GT2 family glycosyltransferase
MDVTIIIVNYNTKNLLYNCIISIYQHTKDIDFEIIVSDNGSSDGSIDMIKEKFPGVILIKNHANMGFGAANNKGLDVSRGKYVFYLNSDTVLMNNAVKIFFDFYENYFPKEELGAIGCNLVDDEFRIIHSSGNFPLIHEITYNLLTYYISLSIKTFFFKLGYYNIYFHRKKNEKKTEKTIGRVDYVTGADIFLKNDKTIRFDERFFLYYEDVDLQYQLFLMHKKNLLIDGPVIKHLSGGSNIIKDSIASCFSVPVIHYYISTILYFKKNDPGKIFHLFFIKIITFLILCNIFFIKKTYKFIKRVLFL